MWASRFRSGRVILCGLLETGLELDGLAVAPGPIAVWLLFQGGERPHFEQVEIRGVLTVAGEVHQVLSFRAGGTVRLGPLLDALVDRLSDVSVDAEAHPLIDVVLAFPAGIELSMPADHPIRVSGATEGPAEALSLCRPLEVEIGGTGLRVAHRQLRWLASQVPVSVSTARLHPDGTVELQGSSGRLARIVQGGLDVASEQLSELVRISPAFERVRGFLRA